MNVSLYIILTFFKFLFYLSLKERRKVYEANLENVGLELETEDKSVRSSLLLLIYTLEREFKQLCALPLVFLSSGVRRRKDVFCEDPRSVGSVGHVCRCTEGQSSV